MSNKTPLLDEVLKYKKEENLIFSMPGNKCGKVFLKDNIGKEFVDTMGYLDITEVDPLDNLHAPEGIILEAQQLLAKTYGVKKAYFMVNGSTGGNLCSIFAAFNEGDEVLVERNCHKSIYNGLILRKLKVKYIEPLIDEKLGIFLPPDKKNIYDAIEQCENAFALETSLHREFDRYRVNKVNKHKEYFKLPLEEIEKVIKERYDENAEFDYDAIDENWLISRDC